jgi:ribosomal protein L11 methyltransferase
MIPKASERFGTKERKIFDLVSQSDRRLTLPALEIALNIRGSANKKQFRAAVKNLINGGLLMYTNHFGSTFIERSCLTPFTVSDRIIVKPPHMTCRTKPDQVIINICSGAAFGIGDHPTTLLALRLVEVAATRLQKKKSRNIMLDIGTGSGILAIAGLKLGIAEAVGTDIDACALKEASENTKINHLESRFAITNRGLNDFNARFDLITANLRYPTLMNLCKSISDRLMPSGALVLSGMRSTEATQVIDQFKSVGFGLYRREDMKDWTALVLTPEC